MKKNCVLIISVVFLVFVMVIGFVLTNTNINNLNTVANLTDIEELTSVEKTDLVPIKDLEEVDCSNFVAIRSVNPEGEEYGYIVSQTKSPELYLANQLDYSKNNYYYAELEEIKKDDYNISLYLKTDMPIEYVYYIITDKNGELLYKGSAGLSYGHSGDYHDLVLNKQIFNDKELGYNLKTEWLNEKITFYMQSGYDSSIKICPNFNIGKVAPLPKPEDL